MGNKVRFIKTNSKRMCSLCIDSVEVYLYLFCIYLSCDINTRENIDEYDNVLVEISAICRNNDAMCICIEWLHVTSSVCVAAIWAIYICKQWLCFILSFLNSKNGELLPSFGLP